MDEIRFELDLASWALRFTLELDGVLAVLSDMSDLEQVQENTALFQNARLLSGKG